jgi:hypothetical protein
VELAPGRVDHIPVGADRPDVLACDRRAEPPDGIVRGGSVDAEAVADRARAVASGDSDVAATARSRRASGRWVLVRGSVLCNGTHARTAVTLEPARAPELAEHIADAHGLTARERHVTELVARLFVDHHQVGARLSDPREREALRHARYLHLP